MIIKFFSIAKKLFKFNSNGEIDKIIFGNLNVTFNNIFETFLISEIFLSIK